MGVGELGVWLWKCVGGVTLAANRYVLTEACDWRMLRLRRKKMNTLSKCENKFIIYKQNIYIKY